MKSCCFDYAYNPKLGKAKDWDLFVADPDGIAHTKPGWVKAKETGTVFLAYLSWFEIGPNDPYLASNRSLIEEARGRGVKVMAKNPVWNSWIMDVANPEWQKLYMELVDDAMDKGYDGVYHDVTDGYTEIPKLTAKKQEELCAATIDIMETIRGVLNYPRCYQMVNRSWDLLPAMARNIDHCLVETVFHGKEGPVEQDEQQETFDLIKTAQKYAPVTILDYVPTGKRKLAEKIFNKALVMGCGCIVVKSSLTETVVLSPIPPRE